jgi:hypothetical protein
VQVSSVTVSQEPAPSQASAPLSELPSLQLVPAGNSSWLMMPPGLQASAVQALPSSVGNGVPGKQVTAEQVSAPLQASPSLQLVTTTTAPATQSRIAGAVVLQWAA